MPSLPDISLDIKVPFHDVDSMHIVWHGHYSKYFELARCELLESFGYGYKAMAASGYAWPVVDMRLKYVKPARFDQLIRVSAALEEWEYRLKIAYVIRDAASGEKLTKGHTMQVAVDMSTNEMCYESPAILKDKLGIAAG